MNKIIIENNILKNYSNKYITVNNNTIQFLKSGEYIIEYQNCNNLNINYILNENITVKLTIFSTNNNLIINNCYTLNTNSTLLLFKFYYNLSVKENITINLKGIHSKLNYTFSNICQHQEEYNFTINHYNNYVESYVNNKCISLENSKINYNINSILPKGNIDCKMDQNTKIIEMGDTFSKINPNMFIEENDVEARHGSVIGKFNDDNIFYLTSRGIKEKEATKLLIKGFILSDLLINTDLRDTIIEIIEKKWR